MPTDVVRGGRSGFGGARRGDFGSGQAGGSNNHNNTGSNNNHNNTTTTAAAAAATTTMTNNNNVNGFTNSQPKFRKQDRPINDPRHISPRADQGVAVPPAVPGFGFQLPGF